MSEPNPEESNAVNRLPGLYGNPDLGSRISKFQEKADQHKQKQKTNPFSGSFDAVAAAKQKLSKEDPGYGRPVEGSKTERRASQAAQLLFDEIKLLCDIIKKHGIKGEDDKSTMTFKELFELYKVISNKVVGLLIRARKLGLVAFEGEMLYQGRDNNTVITLLRDVTPKDAEEFGKIRSE